MIACYCYFSTIWFKQSVNSSAFIIDFIQNGQCNQFFLHFWAIQREAGKFKGKSDTSMLTLLQKRFTILATGIRFEDIDDSIMLINVCVALHNFIAMNSAEEAEEAPPTFDQVFQQQDSQQNNENVNNEEDEEENDEVADDNLDMPTSEKIMWMIYWGEI